jgi:hypothetical protein
MDRYVALTRGPKTIVNHGEVKIGEQENKITRLQDYKILMK